MADLSNGDVNNSQETHTESSNDDLLNAFMHLDDEDSQEHDVEVGLSEEENNRDDYDYEESDEEVEEDELDESEEEEEDEEFEEEDEEFDEEEDSEEEEEDPEVFEVDDETEITLADGSKIKVAEMKLGYQRQQDYTKKTQELSNLREEVGAQLKSITPQVDLNIMQIEQAVNGAGGWEAIREADPAKAEQLSSMYVGLKQQKQANDQVSADFNELLEKQEAEALFERRKTAVGELAMMIPNLSQETFNDMEAYALDLGIPMEWLDKTDNAHVFNMLYKSMQYDKSQKAVTEHKETQEKAKKKRKSKSSPRGKNKKFSGKSEVSKALKKGGRDGILDAFLLLD